MYQLVRIAINKLAVKPKTHDLINNLLPEL